METHANLGNFWKSRDAHRRPQKIHQGRCGPDPGTPGCGPHAAKVLNGRQRPPQQGVPRISWNSQEFPWPPRNPQVGYHEFLGAPRTIPRIETAAPGALQMNTGTCRARSGRQNGCSRNAKRKTDSISCPPRRRLLSPPVAEPNDRLREGELASCAPLGT